MALRNREDRFLLKERLIWPVCFKNVNAGKTKTEVSWLQEKEMQQVVLEASLGRKYFFPTRIFTETVDRVGIWALG